VNIAHPYLSRKGRPRIMRAMDESARSHQFIVVKKKSTWKWHRFAESKPPSPSTQFLSSPRRTSEEDPGEQGSTAGAGLTFEVLV
jgi:hypothetical protein